MTTHPTTDTAKMSAKHRCAKCGAPLQWGENRVCTSCSGQTPTTDTEREPDYAGLVKSLESGSYSSASDIQRKFREAATAIETLVRERDGNSGARALAAEKMVEAGRRASRLKRELDAAIAERDELVDGLKRYWWALDNDESCVVHAHWLRDKVAKIEQRKKEGGE